MRIDIKKLREEQLKLSNKIITRDGFKKIELIAGCDQAFTDNRIICAIVVCDYKTLKVIEQRTTISKAAIPYIPGYLFYREGPAIIKTYEELKKKPDIILADGNGILHPRRIGMASQLGLVLNKPTIGIAKKLLMGEVKDSKVYVGKEIRAIAVKTREFAKPIYVSPGHMVSIGSAVDIVKNCIRYPHKLPEPLHLAHRLAKKTMKSLPDA